MHLEQNVYTALISRKLYIHTSLPHYRSGNSRVWLSFVFSDGSVLARFHHRPFITTISCSSSLSPLLHFFIPSLPLFLSAYPSSSASHLPFVIFNSSFYTGPGGLSANLSGSSDSLGAASKQFTYEKKLKRAPRRDGYELTCQTDEQEAENRSVKSVIYQLFK